MEGTPRGGGNDVDLTSPEILREALRRASTGGTALVVAPDHERMKVLMREFVQLTTELAHAGGAAPMPWDDRTVRVGDGFCAFFTSETIDFVLERKHWYGARSGPPPLVLWDEGARERAAEWAKLIPDESIDRSHLLFGKTSPDHDER